MDLLSRVLALTDTTRLSEDTGDGRSWYKEWYHFCIVAPEVAAVVNFSVADDNRPAAVAGARQARVILLVQDGAWDGDVCEIPFRDVQLNPRRIDLRFGQNRLDFHDGVFRISVALESRPLTLDLHIRPITYPLLRSRSPIGSGAIDWLVVPRLQASGTVICNRNVHHLVDAPAYHDHNWGRWLWGQDFAWEWGFALPAQSVTPWSLVYDRMSNRARSQAQDLKLCLWKDDQLVRIFAHQDVTVDRKGHVMRRQVPKFPRIMALVAPQMTTDVPRRLEIEAVSGSDRLRCCFEAEEVAQIVVPNETDLGETIINEVTGKVSATGNVKGDSVEIEGRGLFEFLG